ncbi:pyruvate:ferredoxin (flavodoxin) oxidoreductase [Intestinimonas butyriciproducens]|uniref:pyruvate:ferredoxin (flavodoxin) oxidoreductase n=1 Tax=Intestinimonas butyriciproducens TaxID=1297617 RepID=UPI00051AD102|nr:pyruvate:ferredoxin (flavodoxin) oxidoreductase [Intestinimonas butyriciproducens]MBO3279591.1 pyruvate:ferredoxin (flavodoxin) oxidoreductase [Intestinimonas butyriciproducens]MBS6522319.1 pyruvate:ferredoxin (flavodoxin) oxidoreductase [Clostridiales bacterium]MBU5228683.1 pyruvate:ferredoxin (flavodoxin) oxidoreductase [Intestinimonas butyriciproducens]MCB7050022.1 pyruvate:ferredoxin (flavodoxin) oxidoreductase [Intestinimonas butyriciproducens]
MARKKKSMDGNTAAAHVSYAFTEVAGIYPITPSSPMADNVDQWAAAGRKNIFGDPVRVIEMQSEAGAAGTVHGSLNAGALTTTYTASQGLLLMIPNMYKIAAELLPAVFHVSARTVATQSLNIFGDHSDVMACRQTGFAMLAETNPQEVMDLGAVAHLAAIKGRVPFLNFFDGFRTSHEIQKIDIWDYEDLKDMVDMDAIEAFRARALNPEHPTMRGSHENGDIFFQHREACNQYYEAVPEIVEEYMGKVNAKLGTNYQLFNYYGAPDADRVIIAMGSICDVAEEVIDYLNAHGEKVGLVKVRLYRPFRADKLLAAIPETAKKIAVLDRTKEPGSQGEPLYMDVITAFANAGRQAVITGGRYGLGSKDTPPRSVFAVYEDLAKDAPKHEFTIGIVDDVTNLSLPEHDCPNTAAAGTIECKFWGLGGDGTVGANKNSIKIIGDHTDKYVQAYFQYDSKKTGGVTISHLRFGDKPIKSPYYINKADFVACHVPAYIIKGFPMVRDVKDGGTFLINCQWSDEELDKHMPAVAKRYIAEHHINVYTIDAIDLAAKIGMGKRTNTILQSAFFALANVMPQDEAIGYMKDAATHSYLKKGQDVVDMNHKAIDTGATAFKKFNVPASWATAADEVKEEKLEGRDSTVKMVTEIMEPVGRMDGDSLPVSAFSDHVDGTFEQGAAAYEKRGVAVMVPTWNADKCIQCNQCSYVCPHATIRPYALTDEEAKNAPEAAKIVDFKAGKGKGVYKFSIAVSPLDCMGCGVCVGVCPVKALEMVPQESQAEQQPVFDYMVAKVADKDDVADTTSVKGSQFKQPLLEFSGSCAGCAETSYARLITQVCGDRMYISNATGCSSIWGGPAATSPYTVNKQGKGPAWANSLFEDNAEHGLGFYYGQKALRDRLTEQTKALLAIDYADEDIKAAGQEWLDTKADGVANAEATKKYVAALEAIVSQRGDCGCDACKLAREILAHKEFLAKKSIWIFGGDGWAYDIGFGGLDHVLASGEDVNVMVFDTEVYSNTGGQASKSTNVGAVAQFAAAGKTMPKKSLAEIAMSYGYVYVAQVAMGANPAQTLKAITEAENYHGPSLIIGYAPCEMHSIKGGMTNCQSEMKKAVECGYWNMFRFNPALKAEGKSPFTLDSKAPAGGYQEFLMNEARYSALTRAFPERAEKLFQENEALAKARYEHLVKLQELYA